MKISHRWLRRIIRYFVAAIACLSLIACSSTPQTETANKISVEMSTARDINPNDQGVGNPLRIMIYALKSPDEFMSSDFFTITEENTPSLQQQMEKVYDGIVLPNKKKKIELAPNNDITAIGVIAAYRDIEKTEWKAVIHPLPEKRVQPWYKRILSWKRPPAPAIKVSVERLSISIKEMD
jgi:type VI secretion system protein VasD